MHVQDDLNLHILHMLKGTFSLDVANLFWLALTTTVNRTFPVISRVTKLCLSQFLYYTQELQTHTHTHTHKKSKQKKKQKKKHALGL